MLLGSYIGELTVPSDVMVATTPSMSPVSMLLWREHITSSRAGTSGASAFCTRSQDDVFGDGMRRFVTGDLYGGHGREKPVFSSYSWSHIPCSGMIGGNAQGLGSHQL
jgi:hypothetical protein